VNMVVDHTSPDLIKRLEAVDKFSAIEELAGLFKGKNICDDIDQLVSALKEREGIMSTGIGFGIAIPHAKIPSVNEIAFSVGISKQGIDFDSMDGQPVNIIILVIAGDKQHKEYLKILSSIMATLKDTEKRNAIIDSQNSEEVLKILS
jgi:mannitol/fructose-specific phosphotransferase system IIA component (Ntr-type)